MPHNCFVPFCESNKEKSMISRECWKRVRERRKREEEGLPPLPPPENIDENVGDEFFKQLYKKRGSTNNPHSKMPYSVFRCPVAMYDVWKKVLPEKMSGPFNRLKHVVCHRHFTPECFFEDWVLQNGVYVLKKRSRLKKNAIPTIFPPEIPKYLLKKVSFRKPPKQRVVPPPKPKKPRKNSKPPKAKPLMEANLPIPEIGVEAVVDCEGELVLPDETGCPVYGIDDDIVQVSVVEDILDESEDEPFEDDSRLGLYDDEPSTPASPVPNSPEPTRSSNITEPLDDRLPLYRYLTFSDIKTMLQDRDVRLPSTAWNYFCDSDTICISHADLKRSPFPVFDKTITIKENGAFLLVSGQVKMKDLFFSTVDSLNSLLEGLDDQKVCLGTATSVSEPLSYHKNCPLLLPKSQDGPRCMFCDASTNISK